jgi:chromosome condensin MukBEF ATPase and DNA-binding subunit MukB
VEADKDGLIEDLQQHIMDAGMEIAQSSAATNSLKQQLENRVARDEQIAHALCSTETHTQQLEAMCARMERSSYEQVGPCHVLPHAAQFPGPVTWNALLFCLQSALQILSPRVLN